MRIDRLAGVVLAVSLILPLTLACGDDDDGGSTGPDPTGSIEVSLTVAGDAPDADGCVFTIDGASQRRILSGESTTYTGLSVGQHEVAISDVAGNCQVLGEAVRSISVAANQTATSTFAVTCSQDVGGIEVSVTTTGEDQDADGYHVVIDGGTPVVIDINGSVTAGGLAPGDHTVALEGVAANCSVGGGNPRTVAVTPGQTAAAAFAVLCSSLSGSIRVIAATTGEDQDADGYEIVVDGGPPSAIDVNSAITIGGLDPGNYSLELLGEAFNCDVSGGNQRTAAVTAGVETQVSFDVTCRYHLYDRIAFQSNRTGSWQLYALDPYVLPSERALGLSGRHPAVSPDGLRIAYSSDNDIWIALSDGSSAARVTNTPENEFYPAWSADGTQLAFERDGEIWTMGDDGTNQARIFDFGTQPTWSPDGSRIAFTDAGHVWVINADGSDLDVLTSGNPTANQRPAWSPLGNYIGFASARDGSLHIFIKDPAGGTAINMTIALISQATDPTWAPLAEAGAFSSDDSGTYDIYYFVPGSAGLVRLTDHPLTDAHPSWGGGN